MKRRTAYKVAAAMVAGTSTHNGATRTRALRVVRRGYQRGRWDGVFTSAALGQIDLGVWWKTHVAGPLLEFQEAMTVWAKRTAVAFEDMSRSMVAAFAKIPTLEVPVHA